MLTRDEKEAFDLIEKIVDSVRVDSARLPNKLDAALEEIRALAKYKGAHGNIISEDRRKLFGLDND